MYNFRSLGTSKVKEPVILKSIGHLYGNPLSEQSFQPNLSLRKKLIILAANHPEGGYFLLLLEWSKKNWLIPSQVREVTLAYNQVFECEKELAH